MLKGDNVAAQQTAWLIVAAAGPILSFAGKYSAVDVLIAVLICAVLCLTVSQCTAKPGKWVSFVQIFSTTAYLGSIAGKSATCWTQMSNLPIVPWTLLAVAVFAAGKGGDRARRTGSVLLWLFLPIVGATLFAGAGELDISIVRRMEGCVPWELIPLFLLPCLHDYSADRKTPITRKGIWFVGFIAVIAAFWMDAALSSQVATQSENAFLEYSKGITILGTAKRFEALVSCALTVGWFGFYSYLLRAAYASGERIGKGKGGAAVWICAVTGAIVMWKLHIPVEATVVFILISWAFLPLITQILEKVKNMYKPSKQT